MSSEFFKNYLNRLSGLLEKVNVGELEKFVVELGRARERGANIFVFGNGGTASTASHFACDMNKSASYKRAKKFKFICLNDNLPTILAYANDVSYADVFIEQLKNLHKKADMVIGVSASGDSENVIKAVKYARGQGGVTFGICGFEGGKLKDAAEKCLVIKSRDMQQIEDLHLIIFHCVSQWFTCSAD